MNKNISMIAKILLIIGGLNWGLAIFGVNLVPMITFQVSLLTDIVYGLVGISAIISLIELFQ